MLQIQSWLTTVNPASQHHRYNIIIFGATDVLKKESSRVFSIQIFYLEPATNNHSNTAHSFFLKAVEKYGWPSRIERLWRDVWTSVTHLYYEVLHSLEEDGLLHLADAVHLFFAHYIFLPCLADALHTVTEGWDNHPLRTGGGLSPNQLWVLGHMKNPCDPKKDLQSIELFGTDWEMFDAVHEEPYGVQVQEIECPLNPYILETVQSMINPLASLESFG